MVEFAPEPEAWPLAMLTQGGGGMSNLGAMKVGRVMTPAPECLAHDTTMREATNFLLENQLSGAPITGWDGQIISEISTTDLLRGLASELFGETRTQAVDVGELRNRRVTDLFRPKTVTCPESASVAEACALMVKNGCHRAIVTNGNEPVGILSTMDVARLVAKTTLQP